MPKENKKVYVLTREHNEYDQHGEYFVSVFTSKPSIEDLSELLSEQGYLWNGLDIGTAILKIEHVRKGGGRIGTEDMWFFLRLVELSN